MARPLKHGIDYFPLDVDIDQDDKLQLIEAKHGNMGFLIYIKLLMKIYKENYFYPWKEKEILLFSRKNNLDIKLLEDVVHDCIKYELFNLDLYEQYKILTSHGIQKRYFEAISKRKNIEIEEKFLLITVKKGVNDAINLFNDNINSINDVINTQRKGKEKERKVNYAEFVKLTGTEYKKLVEVYTETATKEMIQILDNYKGSQDKQYKSDYRAILSWVVKRYEEDLSKQMIPGKSVTPMYKPIVFDDSRGED
ncbi:DUF4373 domain-containing protein [Psychrobacillus psychrotolerans]|uniref:DUF4373 domain-containing protein n=1 Tax=Psychrobacillus psychrotolerans TaxID=126156 RepID=UPI003C772E8A